MGSGWVKIHRQIQENAIWESNEPFDSRSAWIDLILLANHDEKEVYLNGSFAKIERGQLHRSQEYLAQRWHWTRKRIRKFLNALKEAQMIDFSGATNGATKGTTITIVNYDKFQIDGPTEGPTKEQQRDQQRANKGPTKEQQRDHKQEIKNVKKDKKDLYNTEISEIIDYLNQVAGKHYTGRSESHRKCITARLKEGYTVEEFKQVIDNMTREWMGDEKMERYLCPETIFNGKFETRLNNNETKAQKEKRKSDELHERQIEAIKANELDWLYHQT